MSSQVKRKPKNVKKTIKRLTSYLGKHKFCLFFVAILVAISASSNLVGTYMFKIILDDYAQTDLYYKIWQPILIIGSIYFAGVISTLLYTQLMVWLAQSTIYDMRKDLFSKMEKLPIRYFDQRTNGDIMSNYTNDIDAISDTLNNAFATLISTFIQIVGLLTILFVLNWFLAVVCVVFYIFMTIYVVYAGKRSKKAFNLQQKTIGKLNGFVEEMLTGQKVVKVFNHEEENYIAFTKVNQELKKASFTALKYSFSMVPMVVSISYVNYSIVAILGGLMATSVIPSFGPIITTGTIASYLVFVRQGAMPMNQFTQQANTLLNGLAGCERIFDVIDQEDEVDDGNVILVNCKESNNTLIECNEKTDMWAWKLTDGSLVKLRGDVRFVDVNFSYVKGKPILSNLSLFAKSGTKVAFVGSTGAGKTTITNLINRFYEIDSGKILYDGVDIKDIKKSDLRKSLGFVLQDTHLFTGSIKENIMYGKLDATFDEVVEAARLANADSFIRRLPNGYDTIISGDGTNLSQGQRQLLSIARAIIADLPVLVLDEATSSIDTRTESLVQGGMDHLMEGRTVFVIAHRLSTIKNSDMIIVLDKGIIKERGTHDELLKQKGIYYQLYTGKLELD